MREIRQSGSEGGGGETNRLSLPLFSRRCEAESGIHKRQVAIKASDGRLFIGSSFLGYLSVSRLHLHTRHLPQRPLTVSRDFLEERTEDRARSNPQSLFAEVDQLLTTTLHIAEGELLGH